MGKKPEKMELFGTLRLPKNTTEVYDEVVRETGVTHQRNFESFMDDDHRKIHRNALYVISDDGEYFRTTMNSIEFNISLLKDGLKVKFSTPVKPLGKYRWAYNVNLT